MRLERVTIREFRRLARVDVELPDGVTALVGRNGSGKSTFLEAIGWCLFGHDAARTGKDLIKRRGADPTADVSVRVAFHFGGHAYEVTRELAGKAGAHLATVTVDGAVVVPAGPASHREATGYIERLFHMDREAFFTSLVARQRELAALSDATPGQRKKLLMSLLRVDAVDRAMEDARQARRDTRKELEGLRAGLREPAALLAQLAAARVGVDEERKRLASLDAACDALVVDVESRREARASSRKRADAHRNLASEATIIQARLTAIASDLARQRAELARAQTAAAEAVALAPRAALLPEARARVERLTELKARAEQLARIQRAIVETEAAKARALLEIAEAEASLVKARSAQRIAQRLPAERAAIETRVTEAARAYAGLLSASDAENKVLSDVEAKTVRIRAMGPETPCPTCTRPLREHHDALLHDFASDIAARRAALASLTAQITEAREKEAAARTALTELAARERELTTAVQRAGREEERRDGAQRRATELTDQLARLAAEAQQLAVEPFDASALENARREAAKIEADAQRHARLSHEGERVANLTTVVGELAAAEAAAIHARGDAAAAMVQLAFDPAAHVAIERACDEAEARLADARVRREQARGALARRDDETRRLEEDVARAQELAARAEALEREVRLLERLAGDRDAGLLPEFKDHLIARIRPLLAVHAGRLFRDLTDGRYADLEVDDDYALLVHDEGAAFGLERFSGGEADLANLCLRLAVSRVVAERAGGDGFQFLALDEVFGSQDEVRKANILRALGALSERFRQILLVTHIEDVKEAAEHVLRVEALEDGTSRVTLDG